MDLNKLILANNSITDMSQDIQQLSALTVLDVSILSDVSAMSQLCSM